ncbi:MAG: hypothetical protein J6K31_04280 [Parabacteroides sp.]|nr:hypothetical protein [Parabacteroides sp.]
MELIDIQQTLIRIEKRINSMRSVDRQMEKRLQYLAHETDSIKNLSVLIQNQIEAKEKLIVSNIDETRIVVNKNKEVLAEEIKTKTIYGGIGFVLALSLLAIIYFLLHRRISSDSSAIHRIKKAQDSIQVESVKLDNKLIELLDKQMNVQMNQSAVSSIQGQDHSLALKVADEIIRIEMNLSRMDVSVKGHKQLCKAVERIKNNFLANGYEMVDMLGKPYNEGMKVVANFVSDESLKKGEQTITGIIKPQINYNGVMIQAAQITVSQNI